MLESGFVTIDPKEMVEMLLGIPGDLGERGSSPACAIRPCNQLKKATHPWLASRNDAFF